MASSRPVWAPENVDLSKPSAARMYDYYLGGSHNFSADRELARQALELVPDGPRLMRANRAFLHRVVRYLIAEGIRQFIDIGSGIPTKCNVHEAVEQALPGADTRVLYVDHDPVAVAHSRLILGDSHPGVTVLQADLRHPHDILDSVERQNLIDLSRPVAVLMVAVLHFISESERPEELIRDFHDAVVPGSYLVISHGTAENQPKRAAELAQLYTSSTDQATYRSRSRVRELFTGWDLVDPEVVWVPDWHPDGPSDLRLDPATNPWAAAVGRKP